MKSKAKPAKGSARTKRFDVGGTVGALAGLGTLAYLMSRKKKGETESSDVAARRASGAYRGGAGTDTTADTTTTDTTTAKDTAQEEKTDSGRNSNLSPVEQHAAITKRNSVEPSDNTPVSTNDKKPKNQNQNQNQNRNRNRNQNQNRNQSQNQSQGADTTTGVDAGVTAGKRKKEPPVLKAGESKVVGEGELKPYPANLPAVKEAERRKYLEKQAGMKRTGITTPGKDKNRQERSKGRSANPIQETIDNAGRSTVRSDKEKMAAGAREVERRRQEEKARKAGYGIKNGGAVKKYASGGSVSSASKRADGIAQRGKTRGKIC